jgi:sigma-E factor negative regulatory protein RseA
MSEQIREQISAFLDGELPNSETELLLKRLTRDAELRESFGRYALIGEACRGAKNAHFARGLCSRINLAIDGEAAVTLAQAGGGSRQPRWWRPAAGVTVAASVAVVAVFALQQRANSPGPAGAASAPTYAAASPAAAPVTAVARAPMLTQQLGSQEPVSYTTPTMLKDPPPVFTTARLTNYVFAHSKYPSLLGQHDMLTDLIVGSDDQTPTAAPEQTP